MGGETVTVRMARGDRSTPWGFGVTETDSRSVIIVNVVPGSLADRAGLRNGDILDELEGLNNLDVLATDRLLVTSRDKIELVVHRNTGASSTSQAGQARIWKPEITHDTQISKFQDSTHHIPPSSAPAHNVRVSLEHSNTAQAPKGFNSSALPFPTDPRVKHAQYNSPLSLYSPQNAAEQYNMQTAEMLSKMNVSGRTSAASQGSGAGAPGFRSETMRLIQEEAARGGRNNTLTSHPNPQGLPTCFICTRPILGVMARAAGHEVHGDCLSCATCGASLKNVGHHFIDDKFYCDVHGAQRKGLGPKPEPISKAPPMPRAPEQPKSFYQPDIMSRRPLSVSPNPAVHQTSTFSSTNVHLSNPKTHGPISPANRGVPTNPPFTSSSSSSTRPVSPPSYAPPPPPPTTAPPTGASSTARPSSLSPRRGSIARSPSYRVTSLRKQWPPPPSRHSISTPTYWDVAPSGALRGPPKTLSEMIEDDDKELATRGRRRDPRRKTIIQPQLVADAKEAIRRNQVHKEELRLRELEAPGIPHGINVVATRSEPRYETTRPTSLVVTRTPSTQTETPRPKSLVAPEQRPVSFISEASTILSAEQSPRPVSLILSTSAPAPIQTPSPVYAQVPTQTQDPHVAPVSTQDPVPTSTQVPQFPPSTNLAHSPVKVVLSPDGIIRITSSPVPFGKTRTDTATSPNLPPPYDPTTKPKVLKRVDISKQEPVKKTTKPKKKRTVTKKVATVHPPPTGGIAPTQELHRAKLAKLDPTQFTDTWRDTSEVVDEADLVTEPRRSPEEPEEDEEEHLVPGNLVQPANQFPANQVALSQYPARSRCNPQEDLAKVRRPVYLPFEDGRFVDYDHEEYEDSVVSSTLFRPEIRRILRLKDEEDMESQGTDEDWRKANLSLIDEEGQWERDLATVGEINRRMRESIEQRDDDSMDEDDRRRAIESIERHQRTLEQQQEQLSGLLDSAITFLKGLETTSEKKKEDDHQSVESRLSSVLDELRTIGLPQQTVSSVVTPAPAPPLRVASFRSTQQTPQPPPRRHIPLITVGLYGTGSPVPPPRGSSFARSSYEQQRTTTTNGYGSRPAGYTNGSSFANGGSSTTMTTTQHQTPSNTERATARNQITTTIASSKAASLQEDDGRVPHCEACHQVIRGPFVRASGKSWCPDHFICSNKTCGRRLLECGFVEENGQKFCETCFEKHIAPKCNKCNTAITSDCLNALQKKWHPACFTCAHCQTPFGNSAFYLEQGLPYCEKDWNLLFTTKCVACRFPIEAGDRWVEALGSAYHSNCFSCTRCRVNLEGESFYAKNGEPYCKAHA